jgi:hypothetical protein
VKATAVDSLTSLYDLNPPGDYEGDEEGYIQTRIAELNTDTFAFARSKATAVSN